MYFRTQYSLSLFGLLSMAGALAQPSQAAEPNNWLAQAQAATCSSCHNAHSTAIPQLQNLNAEYIEEAMLAFKEGRRPATVMHQLAKGYSNADIARIAAALGQAKPPANKAP